MPRPSPKAKIKSQPNVLFEATVRRMLTPRPQPKKAVNEPKIKPQPNVLFEATVRRMLANRPQLQRTLKKNDKHTRKVRER
jgi:ribosomal protein L13